MTYAVVDSRIDSVTERALLDHADSILKMPPYTRLAEPVASHPDMLLWQYGDEIVTYRDYYSSARRQFDALAAIGYKIILSNESVSATYPDDVRLNCAVVGNKLIANTKHVSEKIKAIAQRHELDMIHAKQGYAKCSTVCVSSTAIITADTSIHAASLKNGLDALKISGGDIFLKGYDTGFIGGASGVTDTSVLFLGDLALHPDGERITQFCQSHGKNVVSLTRSPLYDYGTVFFFKEI